MAGGDTPTVRQAPATWKKDRGATSLSGDVTCKILILAFSYPEALSRNVSLPKAVDIVGFVDATFTASLLVA